MEAAKQDETAEVLHWALSLGKQPYPQQRRGWATSIKVSIVVILAVWTGTVLIGSIAVGSQWKNLANTERALRLEQETITAKANAREQEITARETRLQALRVRQSDRIKNMLATGQKFDASVVMLNLAEDIDAEKFSDQELIQKFMAMMTDLIDTHKTASGGEHQNATE